MTRICWNRTWLARTGLLVFGGKPTENVTVKYLTKHMAYVFFISFICFFLSTLNEAHCTYLCGGIKRLKHNVRSTLRLAYHGCKSLTRTSKTRQVKCTQMVVTVLGSRFKCLLPFQTAIRIERNEIVVRKAVWTRTVAKTSPLGSFTFAQGDLTFWKFHKISIDLLCFTFQFGGVELRPPMICLPVDKVTFACYLLCMLIKIFSDLLSMGAVQTCASTQ